MDKKQLEEIFIDVVSEELNISRKEIEAKGLENLDYDSMDIVIISCALEDRLGIEFKEELFDTLKNPENAIDNIWERVFKSGNVS